MSSTPHEHLLQAVYKAQPEDIFRALSNGANPFVQLPVGSKNAISALEVCLSYGDFRRAIEDGSEPKEKLTLCFEAMLDVEPASKAQADVITCAYLEASGSDTRSLTMYNIIAAPILQANPSMFAGGLPSMAVMMRKIETSRFFKQAIEKSASWQDTVAKMSDEDIEQLQVIGFNTVSNGRTLGKEDAHLKTLDEKGIIQLKYQEGHTNSPTLQMKVQLSYDAPSPPSRPEREASLTPDDVRSQATQIRIYQSHERQGLQKDPGKEHEEHIFLSVEPPPSSPIRPVDEIISTNQENLFEQPGVRIGGFKDARNARLSSKPTTPAPSAQ